MLNDYYINNIINQIVEINTINDQLHFDKEKIY